MKIAKTVFWGEIVGGTCQFEAKLSQILGTGWELHQAPPLLGETLRCNVKGLLSNFNSV